MKKNILCVLLAAVLALMPLAGMAVEEPVVMLAGKEMKPGDVLYCNGATVEFSLSDYTGYAEVSADGKMLTLNNFNNHGRCGIATNSSTGVASALVLYSPVTLNLQGQNKLSNAYSLGDGISTHGDTTIKGTGSLEVEADWGIYNWEAGNLAITSGDLTIKGRYVNIRSYYTTITGGKVDLTSDHKSGIANVYDLTISGGVVNINANDAIHSNQNVIISGGEVNVKGIYAMIADGEMQLTGGKMTVTGQYKTLVADKIICTLPIPEGVEIRSIDNKEWMDYTTHLDEMATSGIIRPQWRTFQLPAQTAEPVDPAAPAVPTTGDSTPIALWAALAVMSAAGMLVIRRRRTV